MVKRLGQVFQFAMKKIVLVWGCEFFVSVFTNGELLGHLSLLLLALGPNR